MFSYSRISTFKMCPKQYEYKYIQHLMPLQGNTDNLYLGKLLHKGVELKDMGALLEYIDNDNSPVSDEKETLITLALGMVEAYFKKFGNNEIIHNELYFKIPIEYTLSCGKVVKNQFQGYIDGLIEDENGYWLLEIKTAGQVNKDYIDKLQFNDQITKYMFAIKNKYLEGPMELDKPLLGIKYRILKKPLIRQKQTESIMEFRNRLVEKLQEDDYIQEIVLNRTDAEIEEGMQDTLQDIKTIESCTRYTKTLSACSTYGRCPYMDLCCGEPNARELYIEIEEERSDDNEGNTQV